MSCFAKPAAPPHLGKPFFATCADFDDKILASRLYASNKNLGILITYPCNKPITELNISQFETISRVIASTIEGQFIGTANNWEPPPTTKATRSSRR